LRQVDNGMGARTDLEYASTPDLARAARAAGNPWATQSPQVMHVVTKVLVSNNLPANQAIRRETLYEYRNPIYDGWERRFRGFHNVVVTHVGDADAPTSSTETSFLAGVCEDSAKPCPANMNDDERAKPCPGCP